jgi:hypothetical protein
MSFLRTHSRAFAVLAIFAVLCSSLYGAQQTEQEAIALLTTGMWKYHGVSRGFDPDGTLTSTNGNKGKWSIANGKLTVTLGHWDCYFPLPLKPEGTPGADANGKPQTLVRVSNARPPNPVAQAAPPPQPTPTATPSPSPAPIVQATPPPGGTPPPTANQIVRDYRDSLVFVSGSEGSGSGFIARMNGGNFLVTNVHVTAELQDAEFRTLDNTVVQTGAPSMGLGEDIFCMAMPPGGKPFEIMHDVNTTASVGDPVVVLGNAGGQDVVNDITGKIVGIGPNLIEIDAPIVPGNSGSPIIDLKTGTVVAVATYLIVNRFDFATFQILKRPVVRRFGYRLDSIKAWQPVTWQAFYAEEARMKNIEAVTSNLLNLYLGFALGKDAPITIPRLDPVLKSHVDEWRAAKAEHPSPEDAAEDDAEFLFFLKKVAESDIAASQGQFTYDYFVRELARQKEQRDQLSKGLQQMIQTLGQ